MFFRQFYDQPLAQASYLIGCQITGDAIVVDPLRDIRPYLDVAASEGLRITHVTETHIHADFVSGTRELAAATGARMYLSAEGGRDWQYQSAAQDGATLLHDGDVITVGNLRLDVMHTAGHTPEHLSFVLTDTPRAAGPMGIITGDFVFVGDVGRPDLLERAAGVADTMEAGARTLFNSLSRFRALPDHLQVWPGHGAGSACGKALGAVPSSTVGYEKLSNWGVAETNEAQFIATVLDGQPEPPRYFAEMKRINRAGPPVLGAVRTPFRLSHDELHALDSSVWLIDLRNAAQFAATHSANAVSIPYNRSFSTYAGTVVPYDVDIVLLVPRVPTQRDDDVPSIVLSATHDLSMIGLDRVVGWTYADVVDLGSESLPQLTVEALDTWSGAPFTIVDVRSDAEWQAGHVPGAMHIPLGKLAGALDTIPQTHIVVQCQSGARSAIGASLLKKLGRRDVKNLVGGYAAWRAAHRVVNV